MSETNSPFPAGSIRLPDNMSETSRCHVVSCSCVIVLSRWRHINMKACVCVAQNPAGSEVKSACVEALCWARRFLPFSGFLNAEEILQDLLLSLMSELPPLSLVICCLFISDTEWPGDSTSLRLACFSQVADTLVRAFPEEEESVRVALREKYNSLLQRLRQCKVLGMNTWIFFNSSLNYWNYKLCKLVWCIYVCLCYSAFSRGRERGAEWAHDDCDSRQTQAEEKASWPFTETPGPPWAPAVGEGGGRGGQREQTRDGCVKAALSGDKSEHQHLDRRGVPPTVQWCRHSG